MIMSVSFVCNHFKFYSPDNATVKLNLGTDAARLHRYLRRLRNQNFTTIIEFDNFMFVDQFKNQSSEWSSYRITLQRTQHFPQGPIT